MLPMRMLITAQEPWKVDTAALADGQDSRQILLRWKRIILRKSRLELLRSFFRTTLSYSYGALVMAAIPSGARERIMTHLRYYIQTRNDIISQWNPKQQPSVGLERNRKNRVENRL